MNLATRKDQLPTIQVLRGIAASMVVFYHTALFLPPDNSWIHARGFFWLGKCGVDLFFVISGFIMMYTTTRMAGAKDAISFQIKRALRIYPLYCLWTSLYLILWSSGAIGGNYHHSVADILYSYVLMPHFNGQDFHPVLTQGWTLPFELLFYLMFSLTIVVRLKSGKLLLLLALFVASAFLSSKLDSTSGARYLLANSIILEFFYGIAAAEIVSRLPQITNRRASEVLSALLIGGGLVTFYWAVRLPYGQEMRFVYYGIPAFFIVLGAGMRRTAPAPQLLVRLGNASYSVYLAHFIFDLSFASAMKHIASLEHVPSDIVIAVFGLMILGLSVLTYPLVERPLTWVISTLQPQFRQSTKTNKGIARGFRSNSQRLNLSGRSIGLRLLNQVSRRWRQAPTTEE